MDKSLKKKFILSTISTCIVLVLLVSVSLAWMSKNREVKSSGMKVTIHVSSNLVISAKNGTQGEGEKSISEYTLNDIENISYSWSKESIKLLPATHNWTIGTDTGLIYCKDPNVINTDTGLSSAKPDNSDIVFEKVPVYDSGDCYYIDYVVYLASVGTTFNGVTSLNVQIDEQGSPRASDTNTAYKATSIDFYVELVDENETVTPSSSNYIDTLNLADTTKVVNLLTGTGITSIPVNTTNSICVFMRCYFDGALTYIDKSITPNVTRTYVNSKVLQLDSIPINFDINFTAE